MSDPFFAPSIDHKIFEIDLHQTGSVFEALDFLDKELYRIINKQQYCRVIYGIGEGVLRKAVLEHLKNVTYIKDFKEDTEHSGTCLILL